ncbi:hypothetical protein [Paraburkholderia phenoliruptrix]|uniref:hypothetical protein n=1 Tax=Paraburkholderia phenoliruptrix TaxID=252970 RepID=UPI001C6E45EE|nr:hypothetical protein [Paraburkholderia phenoliruptrix]MBW9104833.1 hypothetical protein [Paraburkholderia phenoliruptrix]MBW9132750.1 hypothetical protein [Paraburkholderia ginsengiterrae]
MKRDYATQLPKPDAATAAKPSIALEDYNEELSIGVEIVLRRVFRHATESAPLLTLCLE